APFVSLAPESLQVGGHFGLERRLKHAPGPLPGDFVERERHLPRLHGGGVRGWLEHGCRLLPPACQRGVRVLGSRGRIRRPFSSHQVARSTTFENTSQVWLSSLCAPPSPWVHPSGPLRLRPSATPRAGLDPPFRAPVSSRDERSRP